MAKQNEDLLAIIEGRLSELQGMKLMRGRDNALMVVNADGNLEVIVVEYTQEEQHAAVLLARICSEKDASPRDLLLLAHKSMGAGAIALVKDTYVVRLTIPAAQVKTAPLEDLIAYVIDRARVLGSRLASGEPTGSLFSW